MINVLKQKIDYAECLKRVKIRKDEIYKNGKKQKFKHVCIKITCKSFLSEEQVDVNIVL